MMKDFRGVEITHVRSYNNENEREWGNPFI